jgi:hypothetical protein
LQGNRIDLRMNQHERKTASRADDGPGDWI